VSEHTKNLERLRTNPVIREHAERMAALWYPGSPTNADIALMLCAGRRRALDLLLSGDPASRDALVRLLKEHRMLSRIMEAHLREDFEALVAALVAVLDD